LSDKHLYNERLLLTQAAEGDRQAFKMLHDKYWDHLYIVCLGFLKSPDWSLDILQDVFMKLWIQRAQLPAVNDFKSFLFITTRNELLSALKSRSRLVSRYQQYALGLDRQQPSPDITITMKELENMIHRATSRLPAQEKLMYQLTRVEGLTHEQVAQRLGTSKKNVANTLTRALGRIRIFLKEQAEGLVTLLWFFL